MLFKRNEKDKLFYNLLELEILFNDILDETIKTPEELEYCVEALVAALERATHNWFEDEGYEDCYDHCQIDLYFDTKVEKIEE